jgi:HEAT repeat protein
MKLLQNYAKTEHHLMMDRHKKSIIIIITVFSYTHGLTLNTKTIAVESKISVFTVKAEKKSPLKKSDQSETKNESDKNNDEEKKMKSKEKFYKNLEQTLDFGIQEERIKAIKSILSIKDDEQKRKMSDKLLQILKEETDAEVLTRAITTLGELKYAPASEAVIIKMNHDFEDVRVAAVYAIQKIGGSSAAERMTELLKKQDLSKNSNYTEALIRTLGHLKAKEMLKFAEDSVKSKKTSSANRQFFVLFIDDIASPESKDFLMKLYTSEDEESIIRSYAVHAIAKIGGDDAKNSIRQTIKTIDSYPIKKKKKYYTLYIYSVSALAKMGDPDAIPLLMTALRSNSDEVRLKAVSLMKELKDKRTIDILQYKMKYDPNQKVRSAARKALTELGVKVDEKEKEASDSDRKE